MSLINYIEELKKDCMVDDINLKESALMLPAKKAKWVSRLVLEKNNLNKLEKTRKLKTEHVINNLKKEAVAHVSIAVLKNLSEKDESIIEIDLNIEESKNMIDFLERVEKVMSSMSFDIGNIVKIVQLETT
jgi:hypothetical protein